jgi:hypothetical protein
MFRVCGGIGTITPKTNNPNPEPKGLGQKHCETKLPTRLLAAHFLISKADIF